MMKRVHLSNTKQLFDFPDHFRTIRHRTARTKGCLTPDGMLHMMFKLGQCAEKTWRRMRGLKELPKVVAGISFTDGIEERTTDPVAA